MRLFDARATRAAFGVLCAVLTFATGAASEPAPPRDFADPFVLRDGDTYYAFATSGRGAHIQAAQSTDHASWTLLPDALPSLPSWASNDARFAWAPSVLRRGNRYVLYYTARDLTSGFQCISHALSERAEGPYVDDSRAPLVCQVGRGASEHLCGSIDPSPFVDRDGQAYLLWKSDENALECQTAPRLWSQALTPDGTGLSGEPTPLLARDRAWEATIVEGPSMVLESGRYYLFYSANWYESDRYAIGYGVCAGPRGPCEKATVDRPLLASDGGALGPGGQELFRDADGALWMAYHAWSAPTTTYAAGGARSLRLGRVTFAGGVPTIESAAALTARAPGSKPSAEISLR